MAYSKQTWTNGSSKLNQTRLNHIEDGIEATAIVADAGIPAPASPSDDMALIYDTTTGAWTAARVPEAAFASGKIFAPSKIQQDGASIGQALVWDGTDWGPENIKPSKLDDESATSGQFLRYDGSIWAPDDAETIYPKTTQKDVANTTTETDLLNDEITIGANVLGANGYAHIVLSGDFLNNTGAPVTLRLRIKLGATTIWDGGAHSMLNQTNRGGWTFQGILLNAGATNSQILMGGWVFSERTQAVTTGWGAGPYHDGSAREGVSAGIGGTATEDTTSSKTFQVTAEHGSASTSVSMRLQAAQIIVIKKG